MLQRIAQKIEEIPGQLEWNVSGIVTEYRGANFLLVTHALLKTNGDGSQAGQFKRVTPRILEEQ